MALQWLVLLEKLTSTSYVYLWLRLLYIRDRWFLNSEIRDRKKQHNEHSIYKIDLKDLDRFERFDIRLLVVASALHPRPLVLAEGDYFCDSLNCYARGNSC